MTGRERVRATMRFQPVDRAPLQVSYSTVGFYEHGEALNALYGMYPGDFAPFAPFPRPMPPQESVQVDGSYYEERMDAWGAHWGYRIFGIAGIPMDFPLADLSRVHDYPFPRVPLLSGEALKARRSQVAEHQLEYYALCGVGPLFERMRSLRSDEDVLCDIQLDVADIHALADRIQATIEVEITNAILSGADAIQFGDDYGTERGMILSPALWRQFFKPRLKALFAPAVEAGLDVVVHCCGQIADILEDLAEIGVKAIWPQLPAYDMNWLAGRCRELGLAVAIHTDRANTMTHGTPTQVKALVEREFKAFDVMGGGAWFYVEADNGFPFENIRALVETIAQWR